MIILTYKYSIGEIIETNTGNVKILEFRTNRRSHGKYMQNDKTYLVECQNDHYLYEISEDNLKKKYGCPVCNNRIIIHGINDISTTHHWMEKYFVEKNEAYTNYASSTKKVLQKCPICGSQKYSRISNILYFGFSCNRCSDGISYPNKFCYILLKELNCDFDKEVRFDWCKFPNYCNTDNFTFGIYDFVINDKKIILEFDGDVGHGKKIIHSKTRRSIDIEEQVYKDKMKDLLAIQHGYTVIRIDCSYKNMEKDRFLHIKNSILESNLKNYYNLDNVDFNKINKEAATTTYVKTVCELWNNGLAIHEIVGLTKISNVSIRKYLKLGTNLKMCNYNPKEANNRSRKYKLSEKYTEVSA